MTTTMSIGLVTAQELARMLRVSVRKVWRMRSAGQLPPPVRLGGSVRWDPVDIDSWLKRLKGDQHG